MTYLCSACFRLCVHLHHAPKSFCLVVPVIHLRSRTTHRLSTHLGLGICWRFILLIFATVDYTAPFTLPFHRTLTARHRRADRYMPPHFLTTPFCGTIHCFLPLHASPNATPFSVRCFIHFTTHYLDLLVSVFSRMRYRFFCLLRLLRLPFVRSHRCYHRGACFVLVLRATGHLFAGAVFLGNHFLSRFR